MRNTEANSTWTSRGLPKWKYKCNPCPCRRQQKTVVAFAVSRDVLLVSRRTGGRSKELAFNCSVWKYQPGDIPMNPLGFCSSRCCNSVGTLYHSPLYYAYRGPLCSSKCTVCPPSISLVIVSYERMRAYDIGEFMGVQIYLAVVDGVECNLGGETLLLR